jgi:hypothetical protein
MIGQVFTSEVKRTGTTECSRGTELGTIVLDAALLQAEFV